MTKKFFLSLVAALLCLGGNIKAETVEEDFYFGVTCNDGKWDASGISQYCNLKGTKNSSGLEPVLNNSTMRIYGGSTLTFTVKNEGWTLKSITFAGVSNPTLTASEGTMTDNVWTGNTATVTFTNTGTKQVKPTGIHVVYEGATGSEMIAKPTFSPIGKPVGKDISSSDIVNDEQTIELSAAEGCSIYYTLDGTEPTTESTLYTEPIVIKNSCTISAIAVNGEKQSDVAAYRYFIHKHDADAFYYESFDGTAYWGGNDGDFNPNMQYSSSTLILDNGEATYNGCVAVEQAIYLNNGTFQTPTFAQPVKQGTLTFRVAGRTTGNSTVNVTASAGTLSLQSVTAKAGEWTDYTIIVSDMPAGSYLQFDGTGFLDEIKLVSTADVEKPKVTIGETGYATFCYGEPVLFPEDVEVYAAYIMKDGYVKLEEVVNKDVPANTGVIIVAAPGEYELDYTGEITSATTEIMKLNDLKAATEDVTTLGIYVMAEVDGKVGFHPMESGKLAAGKAYLEAADVEAVLVSGARFIAIEGTDLTTDISDMKDERLKMKDGGFDLQGRRVAQPVKGLFIVGGKKVVKR